MNGILLIDKPKGWTSFDVVAKVRSVIRKETGQKSAGQRTKVGHTGTLDPQATGMLVILVGDYTKRALEFSKLDKTYEVTMHLGQTSSTGDEEGDKTVISDKRPSESELRKVIKQFEGEIEQTPPAYSAVKVGGHRAYKLARQGKEVKLEPRKVTVYSLQLTDYSYPFVSFTAKVSSGTYIRSLVQDIGKKLEIGAYLTALRRTEVGEYKLGNAIKIDELDTIWYNGLK